jgi:arylsulfatase A-like enzyme
MGEHFPSKRGFDQAIVSMGKHFDFKTRPPVTVPPGTYLADYLTDRAVDFIEKNRERPFFLYLAHFGVHVPLEAKKEMIEKYRKRFAEGGGPANASAVYAAMVESVDESVGRVLAKLKELGLDDNTIVIFTSDNGGVGNLSNLPLRGGKGMLYEGGVRVPFVVRWPGHVPPGKTSDEPIVSVDFYPTCVQLAGGKAKSGVVLDGVDLSPLFANPGHHFERDLYWHFPCYLEDGKKSFRTTPAGSIRRGDHKLIEFFETGRLELYNLRDDLGQTKDFAAAESERVRMLHSALADWRRRLKAAMPTPK